jgi:hypothetical protein
MKPWGVSDGFSPSTSHNIIINIAPSGRRDAEYQWRNFGQWARAGDREILYESPGSATTFSGPYAPGVSLSASIRAFVTQQAALISDDLKTKVDELLLLRNNWDGDGAKAVRLNFLADTISLLRMWSAERFDFVVPFISPTRDGSILIECNSEKRNLEVEREASSWSFVGTEIGRDGKRTYHTAESPSVFDAIDYYSWFANDLLLWPGR